MSDEKKTLYEPLGGYGAIAAVALRDLGESERKSCSVARAQGECAALRGCT
jgi:hypothetical protein